MSDVTETLRHLIMQEGPIPVSRFMALALGHYYSTRDPLGGGGDFITAPEISQMFGELVGLWAAHAYTSLGAPAAIALVELGPGRGTLMADALRAIARAVPAFRAALSVHLVETSPALRVRQAERLGAAVTAWHDTIDTLPDGPLIVIANEFFDALPVRQFVRDGGVWRERLVGYDGTRFIFGLGAEPVRDGPAGGAPEGTLVERGDVGAGIMVELARRLSRHGGALLAIDYGSLTGGTGDTLQAMRGHGFVDPLAAVGEADLTTHVDFALLTRVATAGGLRLDYLGTQGDFLDGLGLGVRAAALRRNATPAQAAAIDAAVARLVDRSPTGMGTLFKVMAVSHAMA